MIVQDPNKIKELNESFPKIVYKHRHWDNPSHKRIITHNEIYFAPPSSFKTEECRFFNDYESVSEEDLYKYCVQIALKSSVDPKRIREIAQSLYSSNKFHDFLHREKMEAKTDNLLDESLSIFSVSHRKDNVRLWEAFSRNHMGFCVGINTEYIINNSEIFGSCGWVDYYKSSSPPKINPLSFHSDEATSKMMTVIYNLPDKFRQEEEFRFAKMYIKERKVKLPNEAISEIVLGSRISAEDKSEILGIVKEKRLNSKLYQAEYDEVLEYVVFKEIQIS